MDDIYKNNEEHNSNKKSKILNALDDMTANMFTNKKLNAITVLFVRGRKLIISRFYYTIFFGCA